MSNSGAFTPKPPSLTPALQLIKVIFLPLSVNCFVFFLNFFKTQVEKRIIVYGIYVVKFLEYI